MFFFQKLVYLSERGMENSRESSTWNCKFFQIYGDYTIVVSNWIYNICHVQKTISPYFVLQQRSNEELLGKIHLCYDWPPDCRIAAFNWFSKLIQIFLRIDRVTFLNSIFMFGFRCDTFDTGVQDTWFFSNSKTKAPVRLSMEILLAHLLPHTFHKMN